MAIHRWFRILERQNKESVIRKTLIDNNFLESNSMAHSNFVLTHADYGIWKNKIKDYDRPIFMYPHSIDSWKCYDYGLQPWKKITCNFVASNTVKDILKSWVVFYGHFSFRYNILIRGSVPYCPRAGRRFP